MPSWRELLVCLLVSGCVVQQEDPESPDEDAPRTLVERACPEDSFVTYEDFGGPFMSTWCTGCHASDMPEGMRQEAPLGVDFDTLEAVRARADRIWMRAADHNTTMPPLGGPDEEERNLLGEWLACGAPSF